MPDAWGNDDKGEEHEDSVQHLEELHAVYYAKFIELEREERIYYLKSYRRFLKIYEDEAQWATIFACCLEDFGQDLHSCKQLAFAMVVVLPHTPYEFNKCILLAQVYETMRYRGVTFEQAKAGVWNGGFYLWLLDRLGSLEQVDLRAGPLSEQEIPRQSSSTGSFLTDL